MLKLWMYQAGRLRSHSGMFWTIAISATSSSGSRSAAGSRNTPVVWYDRLPGVRTTKSWASATLAPRIANVVQSRVWSSIRITNGPVAAAAIRATMAKEADALGGGGLG